MPPYDESCTGGQKSLGVVGRSFNSGRPLSGRLGAGWGVGTQSRLSRQAEELREPASQPAGPVESARRGVRSHCLGRSEREIIPRSTDRDPSRRLTEAPRSTMAHTGASDHATGPLLVLSVELGRLLPPSACNNRKIMILVGCLQPPTPPTPPPPKGNGQSIEGLRTVSSARRRVPVLLEALVDETDTVGGCAEGGPPHEDLLHLSSVRGTDGASSKKRPHTPRIKERTAVLCAFLAIRNVFALWRSARPS